MLFPDLLELPIEFKDRLFIIITNGTAFKEHHYSQLKRLTNVVVLVSLEGDSSTTDSRRGKGVYRNAMASLQRLRGQGTITGISVTITSSNYRHWMKEEMIDDLVKSGIRVVAFLEYIPASPNSKLNGIAALPFEGKSLDPHEPHPQILTQEERSQFRDRVLQYRKNKNIYLIHSPGDEEKFGGCVSAGKGFVHITPSGDVTPCPVSNIATHNLTRSTLADALEGELFSEIRENHHLLETEGMPCALFSHPEEVEALATKVGAYRTNHIRH